MKRLSSFYIYALIALVSMLLFPYSTVEAREVGGGAVAIEKRAPYQDDDQLSVTVGQDANGYYAILENSQIRVRYGYSFEWHAQHTIQDLIIKSVNEDQAGIYLDACASRGTLKNAWVTYDGPDRKTVHLVWNGWDWDPGDKIQEVSIFPNSPFIKIDYIAYGVNVVDQGSPGGISGGGSYVFYGGDEWIRGYVGYPDSYYNRAPVDGINDPSDGGSLNYHGYFIGGIYNPSNNRGYGRVMPVEAIDVIKLLFTRGFEFFPYFWRTHQRYTGYIYVVTGGAEEIISVGKQLADGNYQPPSGYTLTVNTVGQGTVTVQPDKSSYDPGEQVMLTANADPGWSFSGWSGDLTGSANPASLTMDRNKVVTAHFTQYAYTLTVNTVGQGTVTVQPDKSSYDPGEQVTLTANADPGWSFSGWSGDLTGSANPASLTMDRDKTVTATFTQDAYTLTVHTVGEGTVTLEPDQPTYVYGEVVTLTATADIGWSFSGWSGDLTGSANPATLTMTESQVVTATFTVSAPEDYQIFLPLVWKGFVYAPDLVVDSLVATSDAVTVTIRNAGTATVIDAFWVDVYFNPTETPGVNKPWDTIASHGVVWGVTTTIQAGDVLTLTTGGDYYFPEYSSTPPLPVGANVYAFVDSINYSTTYGAVQESNEGNNLFGPETSTASVGGEVGSVGNQGRSPSREGLPSR